MRSLDDFNQTLSRLNDAIHTIESTDDMSVISSSELEAVRIMQLLEFQIGGIGQELYEHIKLKRNSIRRGEVAAAQEVKSEGDKPSDSGRAKRQSNNKTKRASK